MCLEIYLINKMIYNEKYLKEIYIYVVKNLKKNTLLGVFYFQVFWRVFSVCLFRANPYFLLIKSKVSYESAGHRKHRP